MNRETKIEEASLAERVAALEAVVRSTREEIKKRDHAIDKLRTDLNRQSKGLWKQLKSVAY